MVTPIKAIRLKCLDCMGGQSAEVRLCPSESCALHPYRFGKRPATQTKSFEPPELEDVRAYCEERKNNVDPEAFWNFYEARGWMAGRIRMKDWKASVRYWERTEKSYGKAKGGTNAAHDGRVASGNGGTWDGLTEEQRKEYERIANDPDYR